MSEFANTDPARAPSFDELVGLLKEKLSHNDEPNAPYTPFLRAVHSQTRGYAQRVPGSITTRLHDFLSRHEFHVFLLFDWQHNQFKNIREQFSLPIGLTLAVAQRENIHHPIFMGKPATMSVDLMLSDHNGGWTGVDVKEKKDASNPKTKRKLDLVALTLAEAGVPHVVMTQDDIPMTVIRNYRFLRILSLPFSTPPLSRSEMNLIERPMREILNDGRTAIYEAACRVSQATGLAARNISRACYWLIATRQWVVDLQKPIGPDYPLKFITPQ